MCNCGSLPWGFGYRRAAEGEAMAGRGSCKRLPMFPPPVGITPQPGAQQSAAPQGHAGPHSSLFVPAAKGADIRRHEAMVLRKSPDLQVPHVQVESSSPY